MKNCFTGIEDDYNLIRIINIKGGNIIWHILYNSLLIKNFLCKIQCTLFVSNIIGK